jgi:hypothetical protein
VRAGAVIVAVAIAWLGYRHFTRKSATANSKAAVAAEQVIPETADTAPPKVVSAPRPIVPAAVPTPMRPAALVPPPAASLPVKVSAAKTVTRAGAPASASAASESAAARPRIPAKSQ